jgi:hypothetical protein
MCSEKVMSNAVGNAVSTIKENLTESWRDWDVSHGDLMENNKTMQGLSPAQRNEVISQLSDGDLRKWAGEINGTVGGLSASEQQSLFNSLAEGLDGKQLARVANAFSGEPDSVTQLGKTIGARADADTKVEFVKAMAPSTTERQVTLVDNGFLAPSSTLSGNEDARAVGEVLASMAKQPSSFNSAIAALSDEQLQSVMDASAMETSTTTAMSTGMGAASSTSVDYNPKLVADITRAAASSSDAKTKARVFEAASEQLKEISDAGGALTPYIGKAADVKQVSDAMTTLLRSDPNGIVTQLRTNVDATGGSLVNYSSALMGQGQEKTVRNLLVSLQQGNDGKGNAFNNFSNPAVARNLGFFTGSVAAAINNKTSDRGDQANMVKNIFGAGFGAAGAANPAAGVIASVGNGITAQTIDGIVKDLADGDKALKQSMYELAIPRNSSGSLNDSGSGYTDFNAGFAATAEVNR